MPSRTYSSSVIEKQCDDALAMSLKAKARSKKHSDKNRLLSVSTITEAPYRSDGQYFGRSQPNLCAQPAFSPDTTPLSVRDSQGINFCPRFHHSSPHIPLSPSPSHSTGAVLESDGHHSAFEFPSPQPVVRNRSRRNPNSVGKYSDEKLL